MEEPKDSFRNIFKAISLFGGVQVIQVVILLIRSKLIAILLGSTGMGIASLFTSSTGMISTFSGFGVNFSAVRDISQAKDSNDNSKINRVVIVFKRWIFFSGLLGTILTFVFASQLSEFTFGSSDYRWAFIWLSITLLFTALANGNIALLQGMRQIKLMAKASVVGSFVGLLFSFPFYYWFGIKGIVPALISSTLATLIITKYYASKIHLEPQKLSIKETFSDGKDMAKLGITMMVASFLGTLSIYLLNAYIRSNGGLQDVGLYQAGISLTNQYIGLVFTAMSLDYFPRLAAICENNVKVSKLVNEQSFIVILIVAPLLIALIITAPIVIKILFSSEFTPIIDFIRWASIGLLFRAAAYPMGYIAFAKGDRKTFFIVEGLFGNTMTLSLNILFYHFLGLVGLGISLVLSTLIYLLIISIVTYKFYSHKIDKGYIKIFLIQLALSILTLTAIIFISHKSVYFIELLLLFISALYSIYELDKRLDLKPLIKSIHNKYLK